MNGKLKALGWTVLVLEEKPSVKTNSGIHLPQMSQIPPSTGNVLSIGPLAAKDHPELKVGMRVHYRPFGGREFKWEGKDYRFLLKEDLLAIVQST